MELFFFFSQLQATRYLDSIISTKSSSWLQDLPFVRTASEVPVNRDSPVRAACKGARCLLESNIALLPESFQHETDSGTNMLKLETYNRGLVSSTANQNYLHHSPNKAIDDRVETYFQSLGGEFFHLCRGCRRHHDNDKKCSGPWFCRCQDGRVHPTRLFR